MTKQRAIIILFDCEDRRASLFGDISVFQQIPSNCECCLFWNKNNQELTNKFDQLRDNNKQVYLYPSNIDNTSKSVIDALAHVINQYLYRHRSIIIVHSQGDIYNEIVQRFNVYCSQNIILHRKIQYSSVQALRDVFAELDNQDKKTIRKQQPKAPTSQSKTKYEQYRLKCSRYFRTTNGLNQHNTAIHEPKPSGYICSCSFKCRTQAEFNRHQRQRREIVDDQGVVISCLNTGEPVEIYVTPDSEALIFLGGKMNACVFECHRQWFTPTALMRHFKGVHANQIDIRIRCCDDDIMYTPDEFRAHIESQHYLTDFE
ncbi:unnamed protein product [Adineta ricciae]|uniref:C2H2-type domain-containing protein n=1 Tax=Adineta ricciae TaxID=249248 RepID=A0A815NNE8_ADIRI|nr:unnamed protein product [Adineta ricciae]